jgi:hypothetical protein
MQEQRSDLRRETLTPTVSPGCVTHLAHAVLLVYGPYGCRSDEVTASHDGKFERVVAPAKGVGDEVAGLVQCVGPQVVKRQTSGSEANACTASTSSSWNLASAKRGPRTTSSRLARAVVDMDPNPDSGGNSGTHRAIAHVLQLLPSGAGSGGDPYGFLASLLQRVADLDARALQPPAVSDESLP